MDPVLASLLPGLILKAIGIIHNISTKISTKEPQVMEKLRNLELDLNVIKDIVSEINLKNPKKEGVSHWAEESRKTIVDVETLLLKLDHKMDSKWRWMIHPVHPYLSRSDVSELDELLRRFDHIKSHNQTILKLIEPSRLRKGEVIALLAERVIDSLMRAHSYPTY